MDIKNLFKNQNFAPEPDLKLEKILLNQLAIYAVEGDEKKFDNLLAKIDTLLDYYSVHETYIASNDGRNGQLTDVSVEEEAPDYCSFLQFAITNSPTKFALKIAQKAVDENLTVYNKYSPIIKNNFLIQECLLRDKPEVLELLVDKQFINQDDIYNCLFFYKYRVLSAYNKQLRHDNSEIAFKAFDRFSNAKIQGNPNFNDLIMTLEDIKNMISYKECKSEIKKYVVPLLMNIKDSPSISSSFNDYFKRIISNFIIDGVLEIHTSFEKVDGKFVMDQGKDMICDKFKSKEKDTPEPNKMKI